MMNRERKKPIHFDRRGGVLFYRGAKGKTVDHFRPSHGDHTIYVIATFTDHTELSITLNSVPVAAVSLSVHQMVATSVGDLEPIAESGYTLLPESGHIQWDEIKQPPKQRKSRKQAV
jgi:hypothetical protein